MRLGKALATGVAEEKSPTREEETRLSELSEKFEELEAAAPEEVPVAR